MSTSLDEAKAQAAAALTRDMIEEAVSDGMEVSSELAGMVDAAPAVVSPPVPAHQQPPTTIGDITEITEIAEAPAEPQPAFDFSTYQPNLSPDLEELLDDTPDFDEEARVELAAEREAAQDRGEYVEYDDTDAAAKLKAAEKKIAFLEQRVVDTNRGKWVQENLRAYPLLAQFGKDEVEAIDATSRRGFARDAAKLNERITRIAKPMLDQLGAQLNADRDAARAETRAEQIAAWGTPASDVVGGGAAQQGQEQVAAALRTQDLGKVIKAQLDTGQVRAF